MKKPADLTIEILKGIRDEVKGVREEVKSVRTEVTGVRAEVTSMREDLGARIDRTNARLTETELRLSTELVAVASAVRDLRDDYRKDRALRARVEDHEHRIEALEKRTG